jgi:energy-coupling factor transport system permease protein
MSRAPGDARAWVAWALAGGLVASATRNPVTLSLLLLVVLAVAARLLPPSSLGRLWRSAGRLVVWVALLSVLLNVLTVRAGDRPIARLPDEWPLVGGALTLNALVEGLLAALSLGALLAVWAVFNRLVRHGELLRLLPRPLAAVGVAASIALTFIPGLGRALADIREAQAVRGRVARGPRDLAPLAAPLLSLGLALAEAMEARGFGAPPERWTADRGETESHHLPPRGVTRFSRRRWGVGDTLVTAGAAAAALLILMASVIDPAALSYTAYPTLTPPPVAPLPLAAALLVLAPAVAAELGWTA